MTRLQRNAWIELGLMALFTLVNCFLLKFLVNSNARGVLYVVILILVGCIVGPPIFYFCYKDESKYDEREKMIRRKAFSCSMFALVFFLVFICFVPFFLIGGQGSMPVYYLPIIFWGCILIAQVVMSSVILILCELEQADE